MIDAAGGVVWRRTDRGRVKVLLIHRPRYDDWSFPKGKIEPGETAIDAALREVEEETGMRCTASMQLPTITYLDRKHRTKRVRYWAMEATGGTFAPNDEVDDVRWVRLELVSDILTYARDLRVATGLRKLLATAA